MSINLPIVNAPYLSVEGLELSWLTVATLSMAAGRARNSTNQSDITLNAPVTIDAGNNGLNGLDIGSLANNTQYGVFVIGDSTLNNDAGAILSADIAQPLLPAGYDMYRRIGVVRTDGSAEILAGYWSGSANDRLFMYDAPVATAVTAGASTTYAEVDLSVSVPPIEDTPVLVNYEMTPAAASRTLSLHPFDATGDSYNATSQVTAVVLRGTAIVQAKLDAGDPKIEYKWSAGGGDAVALDVAGYMYTI